jgi:hypothetical protein
MALKVVRQGIEVERMVGESRVQLPVRAEALVAGAGRESVQVLMADGYASIVSTEAQNDRAVISGMVYCQAAYRLGQEGGARALTAQAPFEQMVEIEGTAPKMSVQAEVDVEHTEAVYESGHMVFYLSVVLQVRVCSLNTVEVVSDAEGVEGIRRQTQEICSEKINAETVETISLSDEVSLPAALNARVTLMQWAEPSILAAQRDLGGVRISGEVKVEALIASGVLTRPVALVRYALPFERLVSLPDWIAGEPEAFAQVGRLKVDVDEGGEGHDSSLKLGCDVNVSVRMNGQDRVNVLTDIYSTGETSLEGVAEILRLSGGVKTYGGQETFKSTLLLPEGASGVGTVLAVRVHPVVSGWKEESGKPIAEGLLEASVLYMQAGEEVLSSAQAELPFSLKLDALPSEDAWMSVSAVDAEASALMSDRLELRCVLRARAVERTVSQSTVLTDVREDEAVKGISGVCICYPRAEDTFWTIGRRYRVSEETLRIMNPSCTQIEEGKPVLIVR